MTAKKAQVGVEMLITYGVVILVVVGGVIILSRTGVFNPVPCEKNRLGFSQVVPTDWAVYRGNNVVVATVENWAGYRVGITAISVSLGGIVCTSDVSGVLDAGGKGVYIINCPSNPTLSEKYRLGDCYTADVSLTYLNRDSETMSKYESKGKVSGPIEEGMAATTITTTAAPQTTTIPSTTTTTIDLPPEVWLIQPADGSSINIP